MKYLLFGLVVLGLMAGVTTAQHHNPVYLYGGYPPTTSTLYNPGIHLLDATTSPPTTTPLAFVNGYYAGTTTMDWDNKHVLVGVRGTSSTSTLYTANKDGIWRYDPSTKTYTTVWQMPATTVTSYRGFYDVQVNQDGDYICGVYRYDTSPTSYSGYEIWKVTQAGVASTFVSTIALGRRAYASHRFATNIDTGNMLWCEAYSTDGYQVSEIAADGTVTPWAGGTGGYGWYGYYATPQNVKTGDLEGPYGTYVYQLKKGALRRTTIATINTSALPYSLYGAGKPDLQTAAKPRHIHVSYDSSPNGGWIADVDTGTWQVTPTIFTSLRNYNYCFDFYQGRHLQTVKVSANKWAVLVSCPQYSGKGYAMAASFSGVRPGIALPSGRNINMNWDSLMYLTLTNQIPNLWNPGPLTLDANGNARGSVDVNPLKPPTGGFGIPMWIGVVVLDPAAPDGIAYCPDTYVMRI